MYTTENFTQADFKPARFESNGEITLRGQKIQYRTVCEDHVFYGEDGKPIASAFTYSYFRSDADKTADRPVIFGYNGGPGSASYYVHMGFLGPRRLSYRELNRASALGPYEIIDNPDCLLDIADIVIVEPVNTGYGVLLDKSKDKDFFGIEEDAEALLHVIEHWLHEYDRWLSPKYLAGESYGCTRSAAAAGLAALGGKNREYAVSFDGIIMIGNTVSPGKYFCREVPAEAAVLGFPTYAAVRWYHHRPTGQTLEEFVKEAKSFADTEYLLALYRGEDLSAEERAHITERVCYYTGVSERYLAERDLKIDDESFRSEVLREQGQVVARYDARITRPAMEPWVREQAEGMHDDASEDRYGTYFSAAMLGDAAPRLNIHLDRPYVTSSMLWKTWNRESPTGTTAELLYAAMHKTPGMRTFFANGWYDICTEIGIVYYTLAHAHLPKDRTFMKGYPSGHMLYIGEDNVHALCRDIAVFITGGDPTE